LDDELPDWGAFRDELLIMKIIIFCYIKATSIHALHVQINIYLQQHIADSALKYV